MNDKKESINGMEAVSMMVESVSTDLVITKRPGEDYKLSGLTGIAVVDMYIMLNGLQMILVAMKPLFKNQEGMEKCLCQIVGHMVEDVYSEEADDEV